MNNMKSFLITLTGVALILTVSARPMSAQPVLTSYSCVPDTCLTISTGVGYFSVSISITEQFLDPDTGRRATKTGSRTLASNGCTQNVTLEGVAYQTNNPVLGDGVLVDVTGSQSDVGLIESQTVRYMYGSNGFTNPSPVVPCT